MKKFLPPLLAIITISLSLHSCSSQEENKNVFTSKLDSFQNVFLTQEKLIKDLKSEIQYNFEEEKRERKLLERILKTYKEPNLNKKLKEGEEIYRLRYWEAEPFCPFYFIFRIEKTTSDTIKLIFTEAIFDETSPDAFTPGKLNKTESILSKKEWSTLKEKISYCMYWSLEKIDHKRGMDGWSYTLEGAKYMHNRIFYKSVSRWVPEESAFVDLCKYIISLSDLNPDSPCKTRKKEYFK